MYSIFGIEAFQVNDAAGNPVQVYYNHKERDDIGTLSRMIYWRTFCPAESMAGEAGDGFDLREIAKEIGMEFQVNQFGYTVIRDEDEPVIVQRAIDAGILDPNSKTGRPGGEPI